MFNNSDNLANPVAMIKWSDAAILYVKTYLNKIAATEGVSGIRLAIRETGCSGFSYVTEPVSTPQADDLVFPLTEIYCLYVDSKSYPLLRGVRVDCVKQGLTNKLIFENPNQTGQCGCGESFTIK